MAPVLGLQCPSQRNSVYEAHAYFRRHGTAGLVTRTRAGGGLDPKGEALQKDSRRLREELAHLQRSEIP